MSDVTLRAAHRAKIIDPNAKEKWLRERCRANLHWAEAEDLIRDWIETPEGNMLSFWCYGCGNFIVRYFWHDEANARKYFTSRGWDFPETEVTPPAEV